MFADLPRALRRFRGDAGLDTFLASMVINGTRRHLRGAIRRRRALERLAVEPPPAASSLDDDLEARELAAALVRALDQLPLAQRVAFVLCEVQGLTSAEAAALAAAPEPTIRTRLFHARRRLRASPATGADVVVKRGTDRLAAGVEAFRRLTDEDGPAAALTRSRMLTRVHGRKRRWLLSIALCAFALVIVSGALAAGLWRWRNSEPAAIPPPSVAPSARRAVSKLTPLPAPAALPAVAPPAAAAVTTGTAAEPASDGELESYGAAHAAHFAARDPALALRRWNAYLEKFPDGRLVPEATYNRALSLARLGRRRQAIAALRPIAAGRFGDYRRQEAERLIDALTLE